MPNNAKVIDTFLLLHFTKMFTLTNLYVIFSLKGKCTMDSDWLEYWQDIEDLGKKDSDDNPKSNTLENRKTEEVQRNQELYQSILPDEN